mgnify:CR=1 FL=1
MTATSTSFISGLVSTLDWANVIDQLMEIAHRRVDVLEDRKSQFENKLSAWQDFNSKLLALLNEARSLREDDAFSLFETSLSSSSSTEASELLSVQVGTSACEGTYQIEVLSVAQARRISSKSFTAPDEALGLEGEIVIGDEALTVSSTDTLYSLRDQINALDAGVRATVVQVSSDDYRLILTAEETGSGGFSIKDASSSQLLQALGFTDGISSVKHLAHDGALSDLFSSTTQAVGTLLGLSNPQSGTVQIKGNSVTIDLSTDSLTDIRDKLLAAGVEASVETVTVDDETYYRLKVGATLDSDFVDQNNVLETLGILEEGQSNVAQVLRSSSSLSKTSAAGGGYIDASTTWAEIDTGGDSNDISNGDTITIIGTKHDGTEVQATYTITDKTTDTVQGLLNAIETAFGDEVTASVTSDGKIQVTDNTTGDSLLSLTLVANNEGGGSLDFGEVEVTTRGYSMEVSAGTDALLRIDGTLLQRSTNTVDDAIPGITLNLKRAETGTTVTLTISRDLEGIREEIQDFVEKYNDVITFINEQFTYDEDEEEGGVLMGSGTLLSVQSRLRSIISSTITGLEEGMNALTFIGISSDRNGFLSIDTDDLNDALEDDPEAVWKVFGASYTRTTTDLHYIYHSTDTQAGTYTVTITQVASQATVIGTVDLSGGIAGDETITVTELGTSKQAVVSLSAGQTIGDIVNALNSEFSEQEMRIRAENSGGYLKLIHLDYGSSYGFTVSQSANYTGITDGTYQGVDVAGTIGGEAAEGDGQYLTGSAGAVEGLVIKYTGTATGDVGSLTLTFGVAEQLYRALDAITDPYEGLIKVRTDGLQNRIEDIEEQIDAMEERLEKEREVLTRQFIAMENALAQLRTLSSWLSQQIAANFR